MSACALQNMATADHSYFKGKTALVTGAGRGIGRAIAKALYNAGAITYALSKTQANLDSLKHECPDIRTISVDLSNWADVTKAVEQAGPVDLLVNNAAVFVMQSFLDVDEQTFDKTYSVNVKAVIAASQVVVKGMIERGSGGSIVNVSSIGSLRGFAKHTVYSSSKAALDNLTKTMAVELGPHQIRVNAIHPTTVLTEMGASEYSDEAEMEQFKALHPLGKFPEIEDIVDTVLYLLSDKSAMIHGVLLPVDSGFTAR